MARRDRLEVAGVRQHVIQRGNDQAPCFFAEPDYVAYLHWLAEGCKTHGVAIHPYCLMTNHVHMLLTPVRVGALPRVMQYVGRHYVNCVNRVHGRTVTLWEGRCKSGLVDSEGHLLTLYRYIEQNPVRAQMVEEPEDYCWSSAWTHVSGTRDERLTDQDVYRRLASVEVARREAYAALLGERIEEKALEAIRAALRTNTPLGTERFKDQIEVLTHRRTGPGRAGRPAREANGGSREQLNLEV